ncbi:hypothetical protein NBRC116494_23880 [Aurantivibrio plasticivorans]
MSEQTAVEIMQASIAQSMEQAVQDAVDTLRNISTVETTVIGVASAKWVAEPENVAYAAIIENAQANISFAVANLTAVGTAAASVITALEVK